MPQMAPISWLILFFVFSLAFMLFNIINYYCFNYQKINNNTYYNTPLKNDTPNNFKLNWKW